MSMRIERTVGNCNEVGYLVDFTYESYKEMADCIANYKHWDDFDYENNDNILQVWNYNDDEDIITVTISKEEEEEEEEEELV